MKETSLVKHDCYLLETHTKKEQNIRYLETILTLFETGPHCRTCGAPQRTPLWPGLQSSW